MKKPAMPAPKAAPFLVAAPEDDAAAVPEADLEAVPVAAPEELRAEVELRTEAVTLADPVAPAGTLAERARVTARELVTAPVIGVILIATEVEVTETVVPTLAPGAPDEMREATPGG